MDELLRLLDEARADERSAARSRERILRQAAEEGATLAGTLLDLAEAATPVSVRTSAGRTHAGIVRLVGADFCVIGAEGGDVWLTFAGIVSVRPFAGGRHGPAAGDRPALDLRLVDALARVAPERPRLAVVAEGGEVVAGELRAVGGDVVSVRPDGDPTGVCYVSASAIRAVLRSG